MVNISTASVDAKANLSSEENSEIKRDEIVSALIYRRFSQLSLSIVAVSLGAWPRWDV